MLYRTQKRAGSLFLYSFCIMSLLCSSGMNGLADSSDSTNTIPPAPAASPASTNNDANNVWTRDELTGDWWGYRKRLEDDGVSVGAVWVGQGFKNFQGGISTSTTAASTFDLNLTLDAGKLLGWPGATFYADLEDHAGTDPSQALVGDLQKFTKYNYPPFLQMAELWYQQNLFGNKLRLKIGKVDANTEFSVIDNGLQFLNSSTQVSPTIIVFPTFPDPMPSVNAFFTPNDLFYASVGAYYANREDRFLDFTGSPQAAQLTQSGAFIIGETGLKWKHLADWQNDGNVRLGFWGDTGTFTTLNGGREQGTHGIYAIANQTLWKPGSKEDETRGVRMFLEYAQTPGDISVIDRHIGGGLAWTGPFAGRPNDIIGLSPQYVHLSESADLPKSYELAIEGFYQYQITPWASLQPDLQYIRNPGGQHPDALVGTLQIVCRF